MLLLALLAVVFCGLAVAALVRVVSPLRRARGRAPRGPRGLRLRSHRCTLLDYRSPPTRRWRHSGTLTGRLGEIRSRRAHRRCPRRRSCARLSGRCRDVLHIAQRRSWATASSAASAADASASCWPMAASLRPCCSAAAWSAAGCLPLTYVRTPGGQASRRDQSARCRTSSTSSSSASRPASASRPRCRRQSDRLRAAGAGDAAHAPGAAHGRSLRDSLVHLRERVDSFEPATFVAGRRSGRASRRIDRRHHARPRHRQCASGAVRWRRSRRRRRQ